MGVTFMHFQIFSSGFLLLLGRISAGEWIVPMFFSTTKITKCLVGAILVFLFSRNAAD